MTTWLAPSGGVISSTTSRLFAYSDSAGGRSPFGDPSADCSAGRTSTLAPSFEPVVVVAVVAVLLGAELATAVVVGDVVPLGTPVVVVGLGVVVVGAVVVVVGGGGGGGGLGGAPAVRCTSTM